MVQERQSSGPAVFEGNGVQRAETLRLTIVEGNYHAPLPEEVHDADFRPLLRNLQPPPTSTLVLGKNGASKALPTTGFIPSQGTYSRTFTT